LDIAAAICGSADVNIGTVNIEPERRLAMNRSFWLPLALSMLALCAGCSRTSEITTLSSEEQAYVDKVKMVPLEISVPSRDATDAWHRAESFISRFTLMKHQTVGTSIIPSYFLKAESGKEHLMQTPSSSELGVTFGYHVTMTPLPEVVTFKVECLTENVSRATDASVNAHILASFMQTGDLPYPNLIKR
jgi:hypothetical protein